MKTKLDSEAVLSWVLSALAGMAGAVAYAHTSGYFVTFMTGNTERAVIGHFVGTSDVAFGGLGLIAAFLAGVVVASLLRRHVWRRHPHGASVLTTISLVGASVVELGINGWLGDEVTFTPVLFIAFGMGALNCSFVRGGEVSIPLSYVTGTVVKLGQGIERHLSGGSVFDWLGYALVYVSFAVGAAAGGLLDLVTTGAQMLAATTVACALVSVYTYVHLDRVPIPHQQNADRQPLRGGR
ncbi:YoaK family protein [Amycolatopsis jiangsuensis]|uniref:Uncharacterized membrane protein YoaK (UPF0700 family) n=1 Tax=Amycolatopsis jiangsuensis TaxID=1181879 RepID=A0A840IST4_9PSEU|nr:YoaK family protein [Amycolatopsis jiangsuensis]MBB4684883.1 uncharacterized membrane protein YoaK (UPF0700 family) [Amycolatopsis jiangsuensis]